MAIGSALWGALASRVGIPTAFLWSAVALVVGLVSVRRYPLTSQELQFAPSVVRD
jgi:Transmembrane secretion effector